MVRILTLWDGISWIYDAFLSVLPAMKLSLNRTHILNMLQNIVVIRKPGKKHSTSTCNASKDWIQLCGFIYKATLLCGKYSAYIKGKGGKFQLQGKVSRVVRIYFSSVYFSSSPENIKAPAPCQTELLGKLIKLLVGMSVDKANIFQKSWPEWTISHEQMARKYK